MTITLDIRDGNFVLKCPARETDFARQVPGLRYRPKEEAFVGPANWTVATILNGVFTPRGLQVTPAVQEWINAEHQRVTGLLAFKNSKQDYGMVIEAVDGSRLFPWQANDAYFMAVMGAEIDDSAVGTGKGPKALSAIRLAESMGADVFPLLIVTKKLMIGPSDGVQTEWDVEHGSMAAEVANWLPGKSFITLTKGMTPKAREKALTSGADVVIIPWHLLPLHSKHAPFGAQAVAKKNREPKELNNRFKSAIFDEAHAALDTDTGHTRAMWAIADEVKYKYFLTNTPWEKSIDEFWCLLRAAYPQHFPSRTRFVDRYCQMMPQFFGPDICVGLKPEHAAEFYQLFDLLHVYRSDDVLGDLPPKTYHEPYFVEMEGKQKTAYNSIEKNGTLTDKASGLVLVASDPLTLRLRKLQCAAATPVLGLKTVKDKETGEDREVVTVAEYAMPSCKVDFLLETLDTYSDPLLVFMPDRKLLDLCAKQLTKAGIEFVEFRGNMSDKVREAGKARFQNGEVRVALCMFQVAAEGLTLTRASRTLYLQRDDSSIRDEQSEGRTRRIGQTAETVEYMDCITAGVPAELEVHANYLQKWGDRSKTLQRTQEMRELSA